MSCLGDACKVVTIAWNGDTRGYRLHNHSERPVRVTFMTWLAAIEILLRPHETRDAEVSEFDLPYRADFVDD